MYLSPLQRIHHVQNLLDTAMQAALATRNNRDNPRMNDPRSFLHVSYEKVDHAIDHARILAQGE